jgi:hypothetical protein
MGEKNQMTTTKPYKTLSYLLITSTDEKLAFPSARNLL